MLDFYLLLFLVISDAEVSLLLFELQFWGATVYLIHAVLLQQVLDQNNQLHTVLKATRKFRNCSIFQSNRDLCLALSSHRHKAEQVKHIPHSGDMWYVWLRVNLGQLEGRSTLNHADHNHVCLMEMFKLQGAFNTACKSFFSSMHYLTKALNINSQTCDLLPCT